MHFNSDPCDTRHCCPHKAAFITLQLLLLGSRVIAEDTVHKHKQTGPLNVEQNLILALVGRVPCQPLARGHP